MWDVDGRELLDFALGMGPNIWGHGNREYLAAVHTQLDQIFNVAAGMLQTPNEVYLAEKIVDRQVFGEVFPGAWFQSVNALA